MVTAAVRADGPEPALGRVPAAVARRTLFALWGWMGTVVIVSLFAFLLGAPLRGCALAAAVGLAPAVSTLLLAPRWGENWAATVAVDGWSIAAAVAVSLTGGATSPVSSLFLIGPALGLSLFGPARAAEATGLAVLAFALSAVAAAAAPVAGVAVAPGAFTVLALAFAGWLIATASPRAGRRRPAPVSPPAPAAAGDATVRRFAEAAHELRTPLNHILGFAEIMQRQMFGPLPAKYAEYVDLIVSSGKRMNALATDWLDMARLDAGRYEIRREPLDLAPIAREAVRAGQLGAADKNQSITLMGADFAAPFDGDGRALRQILDNLIANAVKFAPDGGRIVVRLIAGSHAAVIDVEDNGAGVSEADKARLGEAFERGAAVGDVEGTGLGLALVKALAGAHGGRLDVLDAPDGGALMRVILPVVSNAV